MATLPRISAYVIAFNEAEKIGAAIESVHEESACEGVYETLETVPDPDARCQMMAMGWGQALRHLRGEPATECE